ncbi:DUF6085 family protein [Streptomyces sp. NPDC058202]|uniref:DUF6085 family protein n=1 Tax=Streptomyces sp. NPDC058202 TaxID=3346380 RepID=UPI0036EBDF0E
MTNFPSIAGHCPMGCGETLQRRDSDGAIVCQGSACSRPEAVHELLQVQETEHVVQFGAQGFTVLHPLRERLDDTLMTCDLHLYCARMPGPPDEGVGRYRATDFGPNRWVFLRTAEA